MKNKKLLVMALAVLLLVAVAVGGTVAYLTASTGDLTNTFKPTNITVSLTETKPDGNTALIIPGKNIQKDPKVTASATEGVAYWVFVDITEGTWLAANENGERKLDYEVADGWTFLGTNTAGAKVYYQTVPTGGSFEKGVLKDNQVTVSPNLTAQDMANAQNSTLTFKAYAIQKDAIENETAGYETVSGNKLVSDTTENEGA